MAVMDGFIMFLWFIGAAGLLGSFGYRLFNIFNDVGLYEWAGFFINAIISFFGFGFLFFSNMMALSWQLSVLSVFMTWIFLANFMLIFAELFMRMSKETVRNLAYNSLKEAKNGKK